MLTLNKFSFCYYTKDVHCFQPKEDNCTQNVLSGKGYDLTYIVSGMTEAVTTSWGRHAVNGCRLLLTRLRSSWN